jgi:aldehyde oxidoreductase
MLKRTIHVNGMERMVIADPEASLATVLRENLGLTSVKIGCDKGQCGACTVIMDGKLVRSCSRKFGKVDNGAVVLTLEVRERQPWRARTPSNAWIAYGAAQCGF